MSMFCKKMQCVTIVFFFKQKTAYEMRISDWSSDVCSSDLHLPADAEPDERHRGKRACRRRHHAGRRGYLRVQHGRGAASRPCGHGVPEAQPVPEVDL